MISSLQAHNKYLQKIRRYMRRHEMVLGGEQVLLAVSGGIDSMVMLDMMVRMAPVLGVSLGVAYFDHRLREDSAQDGTFVVEKARIHSIKSFVGQGDVKGLAATQNLSMEDAARVARYGFLRRVARKHGYTLIMTAHSADDNAETVLLNLMRGSGVTGMAAMPPLRPLGDGITLIRPLLGTTRTEIETYAREIDIEWREDPTNTSTQFKRNRVRHELLPLLREYNPSIVDTLNTTAEVMRSVEQYLSHSVEAAMNCVVTNKANEQVDIQLQHFKHYLPAIQAELVQRLVSRHFGIPPIPYGAVDRVLGLLWKESGTVVDVIAGITCLRDHETLAFRRQIPPPPPIEKNIEPGGTIDIGRVVLKTRLMNRQKVRFTRNSSIEFIDADKLTGLLLLRNWREGDRFHPYGMEGEKKISDLLTDQKISTEKKKNVLVLVDGENIVWVCGIRLDDRYKVAQDTQNVIKLELSHR